MFFTFTLCAGYWQWWFRDKKTKEPLTHVSHIFFHEKTEWKFEVPDHLRGYKDYEIYIQRTR